MASIPSYFFVAIALIAVAIFVYWKIKSRETARLYDGIIMAQIEGFTLLVLTSGILLLDDGSYIKVTPLYSLIVIFVTAYISLVYVKFALEELETRETRDKSYYAIIGVLLSVLLSLIIFYTISYFVMDNIHDTAFIESLNSNWVYRLGELFYFTVLTFATVGGQITPANIYTKTIVVIQLFTLFGFVTFLVSNPGPIPQKKAIDNLGYFKNKKSSTEEKSG